MRLKFLVLARKGSPSTESFRRGLTNALVACGAGVAYWEYDKPGKNSFDLFTELRPDYIILDSFEIERDIVKCINEFKTKPIFFLEDDTSFSDKRAGLINQMFKNAENIPLFTTTPTASQEYTHVKWGMGALPCLPAADIVRYNKLGEYDSNYECDISMVGHKEAGNSKAGKYMQLYSLGDKYNLNIYGFGIHHGISNYIGTIDGDETLRKIIGSSKINISFAKNDYSISERIFKIAVHQGFCLAENTNNTLNSILSDSEMYYGIEELKEKVNYYLNEKNTEERINLAKETRKHIINSHTYFHRLKFILDTIGEKDTKKLEDIIKKVAVA